MVAREQASQQAQREEQRQQAQLQQRVNSVTAAMVAADTCPTAALEAAGDTDWGAYAAHLKQPAKWYGDADTFRQFVTVVRVRGFLHTLPAASAGSGRRLPLSVLLVLLTHLSDVDRDWAGQFAKTQQGAPSRLHLSLSFSSRFPHACFPGAATRSVFLSAVL